MTTDTYKQVTKPIIPPDATCYICSDVAMRRDIDKKGNRTGKYLCVSCYGKFLCIRNR